MAGCCVVLYVVCFVWYVRCMLNVVECGWLRLHVIVFCSLLFYDVCCGLWVAVCISTCCLLSFVCCVLYGVYCMMQIVSCIFCIENCIYHVVYCVLYRAFRISHTAYCIVVSCFSCKVKEVYHVFCFCMLLSVVTACASWMLYVVRSMLYKSIVCCCM